MNLVNEEAKKILVEVKERVESNCWEKVEDLLDLVPETIDKKLLTSKYFWRAFFFEEYKIDIKKAKYYFDLIKEKWDKKVYAIAQNRLAALYQKEKI